MPRLLAMLAVFIGAFVVLSVIGKMARPPRPKDTWRSNNPQSRKGSFFNASDTATGHSKNDAPKGEESSVEIISSMPLSRARSLRDALTGAPINTEQSVWQCSECQTLYNEASIQALLNDNHGRCIQCNHTQRCLVVFTNER